MKKKDKILLQNVDVEMKKERMNFGERTGKKCANYIKKIIEHYLSKCQEWVRLIEQIVEERWRKEKVDKNGYEC